jgi:very-short-patch-repair endonuclease
MQKEVLIKYIEQGYSGREISKLINLSDTATRYWLNKFGLKPKPYSVWRDLPWEDIQKEYDNNGTYRSIKEKFKLHPACLTWAKNNGFIKFRAHSESMKIAANLGRCKGASMWTDELKNDARKRMLKRIEEDPNNHPNRKLAGNRNKMSFPERVAFDYLKAKDIDFEHNKFISPYWVDFCIGKTIIEIDGKRWHDEERDKVRDKKLSELGYSVFRFDAKKVSKNPEILDLCLLIQ